MWRDDGYLLDMLIAARDAAEFSAGLTFDAFEKSSLHQNAIVHVLQKIGEAATKISPEFKAEHPEIRWDEMTGMRHRLVTIAISMSPRFGKPSNRAFLH